jgi:hypothetical protein
MATLASIETSALLILIVVPIGLVAVAWRFSRGSDMLEDWAKEHGYRLLEKEYCWFSKGPFVWTSNRNQNVYRITVADTNGRMLRGWARCGGWFLGLWTHDVEVHWDEQQEPETRGFPVIMPDADRSDHRPSPE